MAEEDRPDSWMEEISAAAASGETERWSENFVKLMPKKALDTKIDELGDSPLLMTQLVNPAGETLLHKYTQLNKHVWQRLRSRDDAPPIYYISEQPIRVVESFNMEFFNYDDYQFLGAFLAENGKAKSANWLFTEALKSKMHDAQINKGVFHFRSGDTGVRDNFRLAKKHFESGLQLLLTARHLTSAESKSRRLLCESGLSEIEFRSAGGISKLLKSLYRILTLRFDTDLFYVGPGSRECLRDAVRMKFIRDTMAKYELQMMKDAADSFIYSVMGAAHSASDEAAQTLEGIAAQIRAATSEAQIIELTTVLSGIYDRIFRTVAQQEQARAEAVRKAAISLFDNLPPDTRAELQKLDSVYALKSPRELADMAELKDIRRNLALWLVKERSHMKMIMEQLYYNQAVDADIKREMEKKCTFLVKPRS